MTILEPCNTLTTNGGYTLTPEGERVLACPGCYAAAILAGYPQLLDTNEQVGCNTCSHGSTSSVFSGSSRTGGGSDPIGDLIVTYLANFLTTEAAL